MSRTILIVDDEDDIRTVARMSLERLGGFNVVAADSGAAGVKLAREAEPDAILLDAMMPGMDGAATIQALKESEATRDIPVLFLTAKQQPADRERYLGLGAAGVLAKPFDPMTLPDTVSRALDW